MGKLSPFFLRKLCLAFVLLAISAPAQDSPRLDLPRRLPSGAVDLKVTGTTGTNYTIESSVNLRTWFPLSSGIATNGVLSVRHHSASNYSALFYRGRVADRLPPLTVGLRLDTNTVLSGLMNNSGGSSVLFGANGTRYTLTLPSNSIPDARIFTMAEVTNISGLPFAQGIIGAVRVEPADLVFWGAATLEITFRTNIDRRTITSFACKSDGSAFQLMVDRVGTNRVTIPITRAGVYGSSVTTAQELADAARREVAGGTGSRAASATRHMANAFECQAGEKAAAQAAEQEISLALAMRSQAMAEKQGMERKQQQPGETGDPAIFDDLGQQMCDFYEALIAPRWPEAMKNCPLGKVLTQFTLGLTHQQAFMGFSDEEVCTDLSKIPFCVMFQNCLQEILECCEAGNRGATKVAEVLSLKRQDAMLALNCISDERAQEVIDACSSNIWRGTYSLQVTGHTNNTTTSSSGTTTQIDDYESTFEGSVIESKEDGSDEAGFTIELRVLGQISISDFHSRSTEVSGECSRIYDLKEDKVVAATNAEYNVQISTDPDGSYVLFAFNRTPTTFGVDAIETDIDLRITHSCDGSESTVNKTKRTPTTILGQSLPVFQGRLPDPKVISGSQSGADSGSTPALKLISNWEFFRQAKPE